MKQMTIWRGPRTGWGNIPPGGSTGQPLIKESDEDGDVKWGSERTAAEIAAGVTPTNFAYEPGDVRRYGAVGDGAVDDTSAIQSALNVGKTVLLYDGNYRCVGLTGSTNFQRIIALGDVSLRKNGNGVILAHSGTDLVIDGVQFRGESGSFTGNNVELTGERPTLINCSSREAAGIALKATKNRVRILGSCDIYQTSATGGSDYDIEIGTSGTATLYHVLEGFNSSQSTGGIRFIDCGGQSVTGCQFGKLFIDSGTSPAGVNGGAYNNNRILGNVTIEISSAAFAANIFSNITITIETGVSGTKIGTSNIIASGGSVVNNGNADNFWALILTSSGIEFNDDIRLANNKFYNMNQSSGAVGGQLSMSTANNLTLNNLVSAAALLFNQTGAGSMAFDINGTREMAIDASGIHTGSTSAPFLASGSGTPEGAVTAPVGSLFQRTDGGASTTLYVKESGSGNTGWRAI